MNHADPSPAYFDPTSGHSSIDLWVLLDSACCVVGSAYMSWRIATGAHSIVATTGINAYAVVYAALVHYFEMGTALRWSYLSLGPGERAKGGRRVLEGKTSRAVLSAGDRPRADAACGGGMQKNEWGETKKFFRVWCKLVLNRPSPEITDTYVTSKT